MSLAVPSRGAWAATAVLGLVTALLAPRAGAVTVAGFGDSLTWAPGYLAQLPDEYATINLSQGGEVSWDGLPRLQGLLPTLDADVVVVMEGTNDVRDPSYTEEQSIQSLTAMVDSILAAGMSAVLMAPPPLLPYDPGNPSFPNTRLVSLAASLAGEAGNRGISFVALFDAFSRLGSLGSYYFDQVHPSELGSQVIATAVEPAISQAIVPEPSTALLLGAGLAGLATGAARRVRSSRG